MVRKRGLLTNRKLARMEERQVILKAFRLVSDDVLRTMQPTRFEAQARKVSKCS